MLHILSATVLVGVGFGTAFYKWMVDRSGNVAAIATVNRIVVYADTCFTSPAVVIQPLTGVWMAHRVGFTLTQGWLTHALILYGVAGACWIPVLFLQIRMRDDAIDALQHHRELPARYANAARTWFWLGVPAFAAMLGIYALMVIKPS